MALVLHCADNELEGRLAKVITLGEPGRAKDTLVVRYTSVSSAVLMMAFLFYRRCRNAMRVLSHQEEATYRAERQKLHLGEHI